MELSLGISDSGNKENKPQPTQLLAFLPGLEDYSIVQKLIITNFWLNLLRQWKKVSFRQLRKVS